MNFLAHIFLSAGDEQEMLGNLLGDFVRHLDVEALPPAIQRGIRLHRRIDRFTDFHPVFLASQARVSALRQRFAGVLVDVFYDHYLARDFVRWSGEPLEAFTGRFYRTVAAHADVLPPTVMTILDRMAEQDWLTCYATFEGIDLTLQRIATRLSRPTTLGSGVAELRAAYPGLEADFEAFFPALADFVAESRQHG